MAKHNRLFKSTQPGITSTWLGAKKKEMKEQIKGNEVTSVDNVSTQYQKAVKDAAFVWKRVEEGFTEPEPLLLDEAGAPIAFKNSLILIQGKSGTHKSRLASILASLLIGDDKDLEMIGMRKPESANFSVLYVDTERNLNSQLPAAMKQILRDSGRDENKHQFDLTVSPLISVSRSYRFPVLKTFIEGMKNNPNRDGRHIVVILDVITDCVSDFNQLSESYNLIDMMNATINSEDVSFICIIHENPGTDKARGHLGTELGNKSSTLFQINETSEAGVFSIKTLKSRNTGRGKTIYVKFDPVRNNLVKVTDNLEIVQASDPSLKKILNAIGKKVLDEIQRPELIEFLKTETSLSARTLETKLSEIVNNQLPVETILGPGHVEKINGRPIKYKMIYDDPLMNSSKN